MLRTVGLIKTNITLGFLIVRRPGSGLACGLENAADLIPEPPPKAVLNYQCDSWLLEFYRSMKRLFLAVPIPKKLKSALEKELEKLKMGLSDWDVRWVAPENLHITLVFFGWVKENQIETLKTEVGRAVSGFPSFEITTGKISAERWPIWLEIEGGRKELQEISEALTKNLTTKGSLEEIRDFHPHLTLGRFQNKGKSKLPKVGEIFSWKANRIILYESAYKRRVRIYTEIASFPLNASNTVVSSAPS
jgi:2'-5' RNA ligase